MPEELARELAGQFPEPAEQAELAPLLRSWSAIHPIEWCIALILELAGQRRQKATSPEPIRSLGAYARKILRDWQARGAISTQFSGPGAIKTPEQKRADRAAEEAHKAREKDRKQADQDATRAREALDLARYRALPASERDRIEARVKAENPTLVKFGRPVLEPHYLAAMLAEGVTS